MTLTREKKHAITVSSESHVASNISRIFLDKITPFAAPVMAPWRNPFSVFRPAKAPIRTPNVAPTVCLNKILENNINYILDFHLKN